MKFDRKTFYVTVFLFLPSVRLTDKIPLKRRLNQKSVIVEMETELARYTFHDLTLWISPSNCIMFAFRVGVCKIKWLIFNPMHSHISTGWAIQRITRFDLSRGKWLRSVIISKPPNETSYTQNSTGPSCLDCDALSIYLTTVSTIGFIQNNLRRDVVRRFTRHRNSVTRSQADTI